MSLLAKAEGGERILVPAGTHVARAYGIVDLGTQYSAKFSNWAHKILIQWELPTERMDDGRPLAISKTYTLSTNEKASLRKDLESWLGRSISAKEERDGFPIGSMLGAPCMLSVVHSEGSNGKVYANIGAVMSVPKGMTVPEQENPAVVYEVENGKDAVFNALPDWIKQKIEQSKEFAGDDEPMQETSDTDVPFTDGPITDAQMQQLKGLYTAKGLTKEQFLGMLPEGVQKPSGLTEVQAARLLKDLAGV